MDVLFTKLREADLLDYAERCFAHIPTQVWLEVKGLNWSRFSDRKVPLNKVETDLLNQEIFTLSS
jgi:hypothetical protein